MDIFQRFRKNTFKMCHEYPQYWDMVLDRKQKGGGLPKKIQITSGNEAYSFVYERDDTIDFYMMYDSKNTDKCIMILIDSELKIAIVESLNGDKQNCPNGSKLLKASIKFLKNNKDKLGVNKVVLKDNSLKHCFGKTINFGDMYMLLNGVTWYMSYGFLPYDANKDTKNKLLIKTAYNNKNIIDKILVKDVVNLKKYITKYAFKGFNIKKIDEMKNDKLTAYLKWILKSYDEDSCTLFYNIYDKIMFDLGIHSLHGKPFYMNL
jgi:hypothetical protein